MVIKRTGTTLVQYNMHINALYSRTEQRKRKENHHRHRQVLAWWKSSISCVTLSVTKQELLDYTRGYCSQQALKLN